MMSTYFLWAQDTIFSLDVINAMENGKPTMQEQTKKGLLSFAMLTRAKGSAKLTGWFNKSIILDGELEVISKKRYDATSTTLASYKTEFTWYSTDDEGIKVKYYVAFNINQHSDGDRFVLTLVDGPTVRSFAGKIKIL